MSRRLKPEPLAKLLPTRDRKFGALIERGRLLRQLSESVRDCLPLACAEHCAVANYHDGQLVLATESPAWSARLRFHARDVTRLLKDRHGLRVRQVRVVVSPAAVSPTPKRGARRDLSHKSAELLQQAAAGIEDPALRGALLRLARNSRRR